LPGSGKSYLIKNKFSNHNLYRIYDDVNKDAINDINYFIYSQHYPNIIFDIKKAEKNIIILDISFCDYKKYCHAKNILGWWVGNDGNKYRIINIAFENNLNKIKKNITNNEGNYENNRLKRAELFSSNYSAKKYIRNKYDKLLLIHNKK